MATTAWTATSGDWNDPANWTEGVPTAADDAVFPAAFSGGTITGDGAAGSIALEDGAGTLTVTGSHDVTTLSDDGDALDLTAAASLSFQSMLLENGATLGFADAGQLGQGTVTIDDASVPDGLTNPVVLAGTAYLEGTQLLSNAITGDGTLSFSAPDYVSPVSAETLTGAAGGYAGAISLYHSQLDLPVSGAGIDTVSAGGFSAVTAADQSLEVFVTSGDFVLNQGAGRATIIGAVGVQPSAVYDLGIYMFESIDVTGGTGSVTVFGGDAHGAIYGGAAGGNVIVAGATAAGFDGQDLQFPVSELGPVTVGGGGNGDLLVATGQLDNLFAAAGGNETLTGAAATGNNSFFGGSGADEIVAGAGQDTVVAGSGSATVFGGSGATDVFAEAGRVVMVGGAASDYLQVGTGAATAFTGVGGDLFGVISGQSGGTLTIAGFRTGIDHIHGAGFTTLPTSVTQGGNTVLTFTDNTRITLLGVASVPGSIYV